jgi:hypothetical protein
VQLAAIRVLAADLKGVILSQIAFPMLRAFGRCRIHDWKPVSARELGPARVWNRPALPNAHCCRSLLLLGGEPRRGMNAPGRSSIISHLQEDIEITHPIAAIALQVSWWHSTGSGQIAAPTSDSAIAVQGAAPDCAWTQSNYRIRLCAASAVND